MKRCTRCGEEKPLSDYYAESRTVSGLQARCKECVRVANGAWREANRERHRGMQRAWREANPQRQLEATKAWQEANRERDRATKKVWRDANLERQRENVRAWRLANPERHREIVATYLRDNRERGAAAASRRRARQFEAFVEDVIPLVVLERDDGVCGICGQDVDPFDFHVDHVIPLSRGGQHSYANTQAAHPFCNLSKNNRMPAEMAA